MMNSRRKLGKLAVITLVAIGIYLLGFYGGYSGEDSVLISKSDAASLV